MVFPLVYDALAICPIAAFIYYCAATESSGWRDVLMPNCPKAIGKTAFREKNFRPRNAEPGRHSTPVSGRDSWGLRSWLP